MDTFLPKDNLDIRKTFEKIFSIENFSDYINEIVELIHTNEFGKNALDEVLKRYNIKRIEYIKDELLDLILVYINLL